MTRKIPLTRGYVTLVDDEDFKWLSQWKWQSTGKGRYIYARRTDYSAGRKKNQQMHRLITGVSELLVVDHINGDTLDNRRENLRVCRKVDNCRNRHVRKGLSPYNGVSWQAARGKWKVQVSDGSRQRYLGLFENENDAARAYDAAAVELHGDFAALNFPDT